MSALSDRIIIPAGTLLFAEGDAGALAYFIKSGLIEIFLRRKDRELILASRGPGEIVGEMAIIDKGSRSVSARIVADCELLLITEAQIAHRISNTDPILHMCLGMVIGRYRKTLARLDHTNTEPFADPKLPFASDHVQTAIRTLSLENDLRRAIQQNEFEMYFQPIVRFPKRRLAGFEALIRWNHPERGLVSPGAFIPLAESSTTAS